MSETDFIPVSTKQGNSAHSQWEENFKQAMSVNWQLKEMMRHDGRRQEGDLLDWLPSSIGVEQDAN